MLYLFNNKKSNFRQSSKQQTGRMFLLAIPLNVIYVIHAILNILIKELEMQKQCKLHKDFLILISLTKILNEKIVVANSPMDLILSYI